MGDNGVINNLEGVKKYRKTIKGWLSTTYQAMKSNASQRGYSRPNFSREEYRTFIGTQKHFYASFNAWATSGFNKWERPSIDRINNNVGYDLLNLRLVTWQENYNARIPTMKSKTRWKKSKFSEPDIISIRQRLANGEQGRIIAKEFGVADSTICMLKSRKNWSDI